MTEYKAWEIEKKGDVNNLTLVTKTMEDNLPDGHVVIKVKAFGLNFADVFSVLGLYENAPKGTFVPGLEFAGEVIKKSPSSKYEIGDRVMGVSKFGAYTNLISISEYYIYKIPEDWSFEQGSAFIVQALTAYYSIVELGRSRKDQVILIHSLAGGVGLFAADIAQKLGMHVMGTIGSPSKKKYLSEQFGIPEDMIIVRETPKDFVHKVEDALKKINKPGVDLVLDSLSGDYFMPSFNLTIRGGKYIVFGSGTLMPSGGLGITNSIKLGLNFLKRPTIDPMQLMSESKTLSGFNLMYFYDQHEYLGELVQNMIKLNLRAPTVGKTFTFDNAKDALRYLQSGQNIGKVVVTID